MSTNIFSLRPRAGDTWEVKLPGRRKLVKRIGSVNRRYFGVYPNSYRRMYVSWYRLPKGRYSGIRVSALLRHGKRIQSNAERLAQDEERRAQWARKWEKIETETGGLH